MAEARDASEAGLAVHEAQRARWGAWPEEIAHVRVDTDPCYLYWAYSHREHDPDATIGPYAPTNVSDLKLIDPAIVLPDFDDLVIEIDDADIEEMELTQVRARPTR